MIAFSNILGTNICGMLGDRDHKNKVLALLYLSMQYFSISGRAAWYGPKGDANGLPALSGPGRFSTATKTEFNSEPIR